MIGIDTNLLARYIVEDDVVQAAASVELIDEVCTADNPGFVDAMVLIELIWLLDSVYRYERSEILTVLQNLLSMDRLIFEDSELVAETVFTCSTSNADFADVLISLRNRSRACDTTYTFDQRASRLETFTLLR